MQRGGSSQWEMFWHSAVIVNVIRATIMDVNFRK